MIFYSRSYFTEQRRREHGEVEGTICWKFMPLEQLQVLIIMDLYIKMNKIENREIYKKWDGNISWVHIAFTRSSTARMKRSGMRTSGVPRVGLAGIIFTGAIRDGS